MAKLTVKKGELEKQMDKLREKMDKSDYKEKVPVKVQELDADKVGCGGENVITQVLVWESGAFPQ